MVDSHGKLESKYFFFTIHGSSMGKKPPKNPLILGPPYILEDPPPKWVVHFGSELEHPPKHRPRSTFRLFTAICKASCQNSKRSWETCNDFDLGFG